MLLKGRVAVVTGGSSGIGRGVCLELAKEGARIAIVDITEDPRRGKYHEQNAVTPTLTEVRAIGGEGMFVQADIANQEEAKRTIDTVVSTFGKLDILVNNAGIFVQGGCEELPVKEWDRIVGINLRAVFLMTKYSVPSLKRSTAGRIINIASVHAFGGGGGPAYAPAKAGVVNMTKDTAVEMGKHRVTANAICPGYIETAIQDYMTPDQIEACRQKTPIPRLGRPRDIGRACSFLASDDAEWITGAVLVVDGGWCAHV